MALVIPSLILKRMHPYRSLTNSDEGVDLSVKNRLGDAELTGISKVKIDGKEIHLESVTLFIDDGTRLPTYDLAQSPLDFPLRRSVGVNCDIEPLALGIQKIEIHFDSKPFGRVKLKAEDAISVKVQGHARIPRSSTDDYSDPYLASKFAYLRFNFTTSDAAGHNMVGRATFAACSWIGDEYPGIRHFYLESNLATDKKASQVNIIRTGGKRVTVEAVVDRDILIQQLRVEPEALYYHANVSNVGTNLSGVNNDGAHSANGITALFIATGQDVAYVSESSTSIH